MLLLPLTTRLPQSGNPQSDVHLSSAGKVEGVECHLSGGLTNRLRSRTHKFDLVKNNAFFFIFENLPVLPRDQQLLQGQPALEDI